MTWTKRIQNQTKCISKTQKIRLSQNQHRLNVSPWQKCPQKWIFWAKTLRNSKTRARTIHPTRLIFPSRRNLHLIINKNSRSSSNNLIHNSRIMKMSFRPCLSIRKTVNRVRSTSLRKNRSLSRFLSRMMILRISIFQMRTVFPIKVIVRFKTRKPNSTRTTSSSRTRRNSRIFSLSRNSRNQNPTKTRSNSTCWRTRKQNQRPLSK